LQNIGWLRKVYACRNAWQKADEFASFFSESDWVILYWNFARYCESAILILNEWISGPLRISLSF
jgi:hypothetical protein